MIEQDTSAACIGIAGSKLSPISLQDTDTGAEVDLAGDCGMIRTVFGQTGWRDLVKNRDGWMKNWEGSCSGSGAVTKRKKKKFS